MLMNALRKGAIGGVFKFVIFGFLLFAVGGMVFMDNGGFFRNGVSNNDVAKVGKQKVSIVSFDRNLRRSLGNLGISPAQAFKLGYVEQMLNSEIHGRLMSEAANDLGIAVDKKHVAKQVRTLLAPMLQQGDNPKDVLKQILMAQGMSESDLSNAIGQEITMGLLNQTISGGAVTVPDGIVRDLYAFQNETRNVVYISFKDADLKTALAPSDEQLKELYEATKESFASPEKRTLQIVKIKTEALKKTIDISDEEVRNSYDDNIALYTEKEQRTLEQSLFEKEEDAKAVAEKAKSGTPLKQAIKDTTGRDTDYLGDRTSDTDSLGPEIREQVVATTKGNVVGPIKTSIGWHVIVVKDIIPSQTKSFDSVKTEIRNELLDNKAIDQQYALAGTVEDMLAGGASLEDVQKEVDLEVTTLPQINAYGQGADGKDALKDFEKIKTTILETGFQLEQGETSPMAEAADGSTMGINVKSIEPKTYKPYEDVKAAMSERWMADQRRIENKMQTLQTLDDLKAAKTAAADFAKAQKKPLQSLSSLKRFDKPQSPLEPRGLMNIFEAKPNQPFILDIEGGTSIAWVTEAKLPEKIDTDSKNYKDFRTALLNATQNESIMLYSQNKREKYGASVNRKLLESTYGKDDKAE